MTTEGNAEVPTEQVMGVSEAWAYYRKEVAALGTWHDSAWSAQERAIAAVVEYSIRASERTRLEARLAEVEADLTALRAAVRPLVEAVKPIAARLDPCPACSDPDCAADRALLAALADPAIAALLEGGNDAH